MEERLLKLTGKLTPEKIRAAFKVAVLTGHADKGGNMDMALLTAAKNHLLQRCGENLCQSPNCTEIPKTGRFCRYCSINKVD